MISVDLYRKISRFLTFLVLCAPLIVYGGTQFPFSIPRWVWLLATVLVFFIYTIAIHKSEVRVGIRKIDVGLVCFVGVLLLSLFVTTDLRQSVWSTAGRTTGIALYVLWFLWFIAMRLSAWTPKEWKWILESSIGIATIAAVWGVGEYLIFRGTAAPEDRVSGPAGNALILATYLAPYLFIILFLLVERARFALRKAEIITGIVCAGIIACAVGLTFSRSSYLGIVLGLIVGVVGYAISVRKIGTHRHTVRIIAITFAVIIAAYGSLYAYARVTDAPGAKRLIITQNALLTLKTRFINWKIAIRAIQEHPILGFGWENYRTAADKYFDPALATYSYYETRIDKPHNTLLEVWVTTGTIGLVVYIAFLCVIILTAWRLYKTDRLSIQGFWSVVGFFVAYHVQNLFAFDTPQTLFTQGLFLAYLAAHDDSVLTFHSTAWKVIRMPLVSLCALGGIAVFVYAGYAPLRTMSYIKTGLDASYAHNFALVDESFGHAFSGLQGPYYFETWRWFAESLLHGFAANETKLSDLSPDEQNRWRADVAHIDSLTDQYVAAHPTSVEWQTFAGKVSYYSALARNDVSRLTQAEQDFLRAYSISHYRQEPPILLSYIYGLEGKNAEAVAWYTTAVALTPSNETHQALDFLLDLFVKQRDNATIVALLESTVHAEPTADMYARLAAAYATAHRFDDARTAVLQAVQLDSSFASEADRFISQFPKK